MTADELRDTLRDQRPPVGLPLLIEAMWWEGHGNWAHAHSLVDALTTRQAAWVHAYLHRREGDLSNATYWYRQAGRAPERGDLEAEWALIVTGLI